MNIGMYDLSSLLREAASIAAERYDTVMHLSARQARTWGGLTKSVKRMPATAAIAQRPAAVMYSSLQNKASA
jgi:hypothetical protein